METWQDYLDSLDDIYEDLMKEGYKYHEIDNMDLNGFLRLANRKGQSTGSVPIDQILKPVGF
ncbi:hypothetical protein MH138_07975 [Bacillus safensis]|uniref:hypothetical protein n=1 Tax=Bacillus TaxID=1386 RepID=UPI0020C9B4C5|nr:MULTISPECIES: hypothetical protein [Bacillus]MCP8952576.1 hypothetical protein [Bacillus safensis]MCY7584619.1 hypothetical protein [Bacillus safensis]MCY7587490.1 hypothetical protein [Bacillus safensis]MCY7608785.1 hypothetical protein [Bacillus safensis]WAT79552.1 hypothetical protein O0R49_13435 [Bacillus safensis]